MLTRRLYRVDELEALALPDAAELRRIRDRLDTLAEASDDRLFVGLMMPLTFGDFEYSWQPDVARARALAHARRLTALGEEQIGRMSARYSELVELAKRTGNPAIAAAIPRLVTYYDPSTTCMRTLGADRLSALHGHSHTVRQNLVPNLRLLDEMLAYLDDDEMQAVRDEAHTSFACNGLVEPPAVFGRELRRDCIECFPVRPN
jgi:hypothetical protein